MNSFDARSTLTVGDRSYEIFRLDALQSKFDVARLPFALKVLLENLLRYEDGQVVTSDDVEALARWVPTDEPSREIAYMPARVLMQDFTGVPAVVDLAAMRDAMGDLGGDPARINPLQPAELVIDHSVQVDAFGTREGVPDQRRPGVRAQPGALCVPALGPAGVRRLRCRAAGHRNRAPGQPRVPRARRVHPRGRRHHPGLPGHAGGHRLPHHDGERPRRSRLGSGGDRGRGRDAGPAGLDADAPGDRLQAQRRAAGGCDRHRPGPDCHADAAGERSGGEVRRVLRGRACAAAAGRPRHDLQHGAGAGRDLRHVPDRRRDAPLPAVHGTHRGAGCARRGVRARAGDVPRARRGGERLHRHSVARPRGRGAEPGRATPATGPRAAHGCQVVLPRGAEAARRDRRCGARQQRPRALQGRGRSHRGGRRAAGKVHGRTGHGRRASRHWSTTARS